MKRLIFIVIMGLAFIVEGSSQTINDIGKVVLGVKLSPNCTDETKMVATSLNNELRQLASDAGYSAYGLDNLFNIVPNVIVEDCEMAEGGMKNVYLLKGTLYVTIEEESSGMIYSSNSYSIKGYGISKEKALKDAVSKIQFGDNHFLQQAKERILLYYKEKQNIIFEKANNFAKNGMYDAAIACLLSIPEELTDCYISALRRANEIYDLRIKAQEVSRVQKTIQHNDMIIQKAQGLLALHNPIQAVKVLWDIKPGIQRQDTLVTSLREQAEEQIVSTEKEKLRLEEREYKDKKEREEREARLIEKEQNHRMELENQSMTLLLQQQKNDYNLENQRSLR